MKEGNARAVTSLPRDAWATAPRRGAAQSAWSVLPRRARVRTAGETETQGRRERERERERKKKRDDVGGSDDSE